MSQQLYPDILGLLSDERLTVQDMLQCALGVFPTTTAIDQPVELLLLLQNLTDQPLNLQIAVNSPRRDDQGNLLSLFTPRPHLDLILPEAEAGLLHIPVTPQLPTPSTGTYTIEIQIAVKDSPEHYTQVRSFEPGPPPNMLAISAFRMAVLSDIAFAADAEATDTLHVTFEILPGHFPPRQNEPMPRYESLWTTGDLEQEQKQARSMASEALRFSHSLGRQAIYEPLWDRTKNTFGDGGVPLHPGEIMYITKILTYVMEDGLDKEDNFSLAESRWFKRLCWLMAHNPDTLNNTNQLIRILYPDIVHDAVLLGFSMIPTSVKVDFGDETEQATYATRLVGALEGQVPLILEYIYVPLVMAGTLLAAQVTFPGENPWHSLERLKEAQQGRISLAGADQAAFHEVFDILDQLVEKAQRTLWELRIPRD